MSRRSGPVRIAPASIAPACIALLALACPAFAQDGEDEETFSAEDAIANARSLYSAIGAASEADCAEDMADDSVIVICRRVEDPARYMNERSIDPREGQTADGVPRPPDVSGLPPCDSGCIRFGSPRPLTPMVDFAAIPEPLSPEEQARIGPAQEPDSPEPP